MTLTDTPDTAISFFLYLNQKEMCFLISGWLYIKVFFAQNISFLLFFGPLNEKQIRHILKTNSQFILKSGKLFRTTILKRNIYYLFIKERLKN